jgi:hypothetical protein
MSSLKPALDHHDAHLSKVGEKPEPILSKAPKEPSVPKPQPTGVDATEVATSGVRTQSEAPGKRGLTPPKSHLDARSVSEPVGMSPGLVKNTFGSGANQTKAAHDLLAMDPHALKESDKVLCRQMLQITRVDQGFKAVMVTHHDRQEHVMTCHSPDQAGSAAPGEHRDLLTNLSKHLKADTKTKALSMDVFKAGVSRDKGWQGYMASGTRLVYNMPSGKYQFSPSGLYGFGGKKVDDTGLQKLATLHANLLLGGGITADALMAPAAEHENMQTLHDAVVALMRAA